MDVSWFLLVVSAAVFVSIVLLGVVCLDCRKKGPLAYIRETDPSDEYINPPPVVYPFATQPTTDLRSIRSPSSLQPPMSSSGDHWGQRPITPTETESNPSYENPALEGPVDSDAEEPGYIIVLPDNGVCPSTNQSRASTPSLDQHDYENVPEQKVVICADTEEDRDYLNVEPLHFQLGGHSQASLQGRGSAGCHLSPGGRRRNSISDRSDFVQKTELLAQCNTDDDDDDDDDDSDDDKGNYVNELPIVHGHSSA